MDAIWTLFAVAAAGVTYDWRPIDDSPTGQAAGAEYLVQVEPEIINAVRNGGIEVIESNVPDGVGSIKRIRIVLGGSQSATELAMDGSGETSGKQPRGESQRQTVAKPPLAASAKRHTVKQQGYSNSYNTQPYVPASTEAQRKSIGSELLKGANKLGEGTRNVIVNTGEAIGGTFQNMGDGLQSIVTGGNHPAPPPAPAGSGGYNPYSYDASPPVYAPNPASVNAQPPQPTSAPAFGSSPGLVTPPPPVQNQPYASSSPGTGVTNPQGMGGPSEFASAPSGFQPQPQSQPSYPTPPGNQQAPWNTVSNPASDAGSSQLYDPNRPFDRGLANEQPYVPLVDSGQSVAPPPTGPSSDGLVPVRQVGRNRDSSRNQASNVAEGSGFGDNWNAESSGPAFPTATPTQARGQQGGDFATNPNTNYPSGSDPNSFPTWPASASSPGQTGPQPTANNGGPFATNGPSNPAGPLAAPTLPPLGNPGNMYGGNTGDPNPIGGPNANPSELPPSDKPWGLFVLTSLACLGSLGGNLFLGWSYLDARNKYQSALRRTVRTFTRSE